MFEELGPSEPDDITAVVARFAADVRSHKMDLGIGVYRDERGQTQLLNAIQQASVRLAAEGAPKGYLPIGGEPGFLHAYSELMLGATVAHAAAVQSVGGTGAVRLALELVKSTNPAARVLVGMPTWSNHIAIATHLGLEVVRHEYYGREARTLNLAAITAAAHSTTQGDVFVLHGPCHNPTGVDLSLKERLQILDILVANGALPLFDVAYYGLGEGIDADLEALRQQLAVCPEALVATSCSKAFGLYQDRVGVLFAKCTTAQHADHVQKRVEGLARILTSSSPAHGALLVREVLNDAELSRNWKSQLAQMRARIVSARSALASSAQGLASVSPDLAQEAGLFSLLNLTPAQVARLAADHAIYMPASGRINLTGLTTEGCERLVAALEQLED